jgi:hypothetical protein
MSQQNYANHRQLVPLFHGVLLLLLLAGLIGAGVNLYMSLGDHQRLYSAALVFLIFVALLILAGFTRIFALKAQDRAIRAEENLRHYVLTGKLLDPTLSIGQIVALRFASDAEFAALAQKAARESLPANDIKRAVENWRADPYRV